jgi:NTP pyrophosphatase (non-canonical NTP hydrolase)
MKKSKRVLELDAALVKIQRLVSAVSEGQQEDVAEEIVDVLFDVDIYREKA